MFKFETIHNHGFPYLEKIAKKAWNPIKHWYSSVFNRGITMNIDMLTIEI